MACTLFSPVWFSTRALNLLPIDSIGHYYTLHRERENVWVQLDDQTITRSVGSKVAIDRLQRHAYLCLYKAVEGPKANGEPNDPGLTMSDVETKIAAK